MSRKKRVSDVVELMDRWYGSIPGWDEMVAQEELNMQVGQAVYDLREAVGLSQADLAKLIGSTQSTISKVESADYKGYAIEILRRVCFALHTPIKISCPRPESTRRDCEVSLGAI
jgi:ribosome-binding protein aMBF1 (putative translation factor)